MEEGFTEEVEPGKTWKDPHMEQKVINEEYKIWKKNSVFIYDYIYARALEWPTLTTQWLPDERNVPGCNAKQYRILFGTNTSGQAVNYVQIATLDMPEQGKLGVENINEQNDEIGGYGAAKRTFSFNIIQRIHHPGEVNKARYQPQNPNLIATMCPDSRVLIFDRTKHPSIPKEDNLQIELELIGHKREGFGMSWSRYDEGRLATGCEDAKICLWDLSKTYTSGSNHVEPVQIYSHHSATVNDVHFHPIHPTWIGSVSDDQTFQVIDTRLPNTKKAILKEDAHLKAINCLAFHPRWDTVVITGSADATVAVWDLRCLSKKTHSCEGHREAIMNLEWHPKNAGVFASSSDDRRLIIWDLSRVGNELTEEELEDGSPELLFMHGGFTNRVCDFNWNRNEPWSILASAEDNQLQVFKPASSIVNDTSDRRVINRDIRG